MAAEAKANENKQMELPPNAEALSSKALTMLFTKIRAKDTSNVDYVFYADRLCRILAEEGLARLSAGPVAVETPCGTYQGLAPPVESDICAVSIVRSGDILLEAVRAVTRGI